MAFTYRQIKDLYDTLASSGAVTKSLPDWSNEMNDLTGSDLYAEGLHDNLIKRASVGIDRGLESIPGLISGGESLGRGVGSLFGMGNQGAAIGADLPRQTLNFLPMIAAGAVTGGAAPLAMAAGLAGTAGLTGAHTYTQTDSPAAGVISGATAALFPTAAKFGEQATLRALGGRLVEGPVARGLTSDLLPAAIENVSERFATNPVQSGLSFLGGQAAALGLQGGANVVQSAFTGEDVQNPVSGEGLLGLALGQLPFSALHLAGKAFGTAKGDPAELRQAAIDATRRGMVLKEAKDALANQTDNSKPVDIPVIPPSDTVSQETAETLAKIRGEKAAITSQEVIAPEDIEKLNTLNQAEDATTEFIKPTGNSVLGAEQPASITKIPLIGTEEFVNPKYRKIRVNDDPSNPEEFRGKVVAYSRGLYETNPTTGETGTTFFVPASKEWHTILSEKKAIPQVEGQPPVEGEKVEVSKPQVDFHGALDLINQQVSSATTTADMQKAVGDLQRLKAQGLFPDTNDIRLKSIVQRIAESGLVADPAKAAVRSEVAKAKRQVDNQSQAIDRLEHSTAYQLDLENRRHDVDDPVAKGIYNLRQNFSNRSGRYEKAVSSGLFDEVAARWEKEGGTDLEELKQQFEPIIKKGTGLKKVLTPVADEIQEKVKTSPDSTPIKSLVTEATYKAITAPDTAKAFASSERVQGSNLDFEKRQFIDWVNEMGGISEEDIPDMAEYFAHRDAKAILGRDGDNGTDFQGLQNEIVDDLRHFYESPHVQLWKAELDKVLAEAKEHKPKLQGPKEEPEIYIPQTKKSAAIAASLTGDGHAILTPVLQSQIPLHRDIAATLVKNFPDALRLVSARVVNADASETQGFAGRRSEITFEPSAVTTNAEKREQLILHEVIHGLTLHELDNPANPELVANINDIRARAIAALPKDLKADFDRAIATDFITRNSADSGNSVWMDLSPTKEGRQILYGLLNHYEFTAQAFSSPEFQSYLKSIPGKAGGWRKFVESIKSALGLSTDNTLLSEVISHTGQLMRQGNYIASLQNFGERWFEDQGKGGLYGRLQTERALGLAQEMVSGGVSRAELVSSLGSGESEVNPRLTQVKQKLDETFSSDPELANHMTQALAENGHPTGTQGFDGLTEEAIADGRDLSNTLAILPPQATNYIFEKLRDHRDVLSMLKAAASPANDGLLNILDAEPIRVGSADMLKQIQKVLKIGEEHISMAQELSKLAAVEPRQLMTVSAQAPKAIEDFMEGTSGVIGKVGSSIARFLEPIGQLVRRFPEAAELAAKGFQLVPNARRATTERLKPLAADMTNPNIDVVDKASLKANEKVIGNPKMLKAINQWMHLNQIGGKDAVQLREANDPEVAKILQNLNLEEKSQVRDIVVKAGKVTQYGHAQNLENMTQEAAMYGAGLIGKDTGLPTAGNLKLSDTLLRAVLDIQDPMKQLMAEQQLQTVQQQLANQPDTFLNLLKFSQLQAEKINLLKEHYAKNPYWATAQRMEQYLINGFKNGKPWLGQASSIKEGKEIALKLGISLDKNNPFTDQWRGKEDNSFQAPNLSPEMATRLQELEKNQVSMLVNRGLLTTEEVPEFLRTSAVGQFLKESDASQSLQGITVPPRQLSKGAEDLPYLWNHIAHAQRESTYWSRRILRAQVKTYLNDPTWTQNDGLRSQLATHFDNLLQPDPQVAQKMTRFASTWFMGFNLASTLVNATQPFLTHVAELTAMSGKPIDSYVRIGRALKEAVGDKLSGKHQWATEEHNRFMKDAALDSERGLSMLDDAEQQEESVAVNFMRQMKKDKIQTVGQKLGTAAGTYSQVGMWTFRQVEQINATAALLASFDYHREQGLSYEQAKAKAYEFNHAVNFSGGRAQRSVGAFSGRGDFPRTVAMLGTSLQSYVLGTTAQIGRYLQQGLFRPTGLQPHEVYAARKAAIQMLGTQFAAAGLLGLPFASSAVALLNQMFPDLELNKKIREGVNGFLSSDKDNGGSLTDIAMTGVPSMLGWDMQSRLSMGNTLPGVSEINGFQPQNLMGPVGNIIRNFVQGVQGWGKGDLSSGSSFLPPAIKKTLETANSFLTDGGAVRDYQGRPLADPTMGEQIGRALGFQPKRLSDQNAAAHIAKQSQDVKASQESQERQELATQALKGNFGTVRSRILQRMQTDKTYNAQDAIRSIAQSAEDLNFPRDLRREGTQGTATSRQTLLSSYSNLSPSGPSEMDRLNFRSTIERGLGLVSQDRSAMASAQLMDQLKSANPQLTRVQLKALAQSQLRRSAAGNFSLSPE